MKVIRAEAPAPVIGPLPDPVATAGLRWRGPWSREESYRPGDVVRYKGASYIATAAVQGESPKASDSFDSYS